MKSFNITILLFLILFIKSFSQSIPIEFFGGNEKASIDLLLINFIKNQQGEKSKFLFFNRNRVIMDYEMTKTENLPQFNLTEAISYNYKSLKGFAPVAVFQVTNKGVYPKSGIQYLKKNKTFTFFGWTVIDLLKNPNIDVF